MEEIWKDIATYEDLYQVSNLGNVRRKNKKGYRPVKGKPGVYLTVELCRDGKGYTISIHRLVALHFIPNPKGGTEVNHIDGNKHNNRVENLEWVSSKENRLHAMEVLKSYPFGKAPRKVNKIDPNTDKVLESYPSVAEAVRSTGVVNARSHITECCQGTISTAYGYKWQYAD